MAKPGLFSREGYAGGFLLEVGGVCSEYACLVLMLISGLDNPVRLTSDPTNRTQIKMRINFVICIPATSHSHFQQGGSCSLFLILCGRQVFVYSHHQKKSSKLQMLLFSRLLTPPQQLHPFLF